MKAAKATPQISLLVAAVLIFRFWIGIRTVQFSSIGELEIWSYVQ